jgi:alanyl-tRNA synthetase
MPTANEIRQQFIDFFVKKHAHTFVPSSPVVPQDDPTLLFTNAGMNQFKDVFLGTGTRPYKRAANTQKCIRAGGKHNDLDDVGKDTYHHTFFEMLGNWSFGDYFKKEAIAWAWELLTEVWKLDKGRLHATVFEGSPDEGVPRDDEAFNYWKSETDIDPSHIHWGNKKDNFWEMGETGPCGPCSEIHYDRTPDKSGGKLVNAGSPLVIEIWNLVFIQFDRAADKKLTTLPAKHVDTGMGFERITAILQGKESNYDTDVFTPIMGAIGKLVDKRYGCRLDNVNDVGFRVIADHVRMLAFAITDGALPDNKGRGSVLRSVLRRAVRYGWQVFKKQSPWIHYLIPVLVEHMGQAYPELRTNPQQVMGVIESEERDFLRTIGRGLSLFEDAEARAEAVTTPSKQKQISGRDIFDLHTTYGFPPDLTRQMAQERSLTLDEAGYERLMREHEEKSKNKMVSDSVSAVPSGPLWSRPTVDSLKWQTAECRAQIGNIAIRLPDGSAHDTDSISHGQEAYLWVDKTCFYAEAGGQVGDVGLIKTQTGTFEVRSPLKYVDGILHHGVVREGVIRNCQEATLQVSPIREFTKKNHTATHLLNWALRRVLGDHIDQKGSLVDPDKTRFDFTHDKALSPEEIAEIERLVNERIYANLPVTATIMPLSDAKKIPGVRAVFGEKYPDPVRVLLIGVENPEDATLEHSVEFCGGTHLTHTGEAGFFKIISQEPVSKGVRRVTAVTGRKAVEFVQAQSTVVDELTGRFNCKPDELPARVAALQDEIKKLQQQLKKGAAIDLQAASDKLLAAAVEVASAKLIIGELPAAPDEAIRQQVDRLRQKAGSAVVVLGWPTDEGKVQLLAAVTGDLIKKGLHAGKLIGQVAKVVGGGGGGKPDMSQAGGKEPAKLGEALELARKLASEQLK